MAEKSGFFQGMWDDTLTNPITNEQTGWWDRSYLAEDFMSYFSLLVGNGVFASPVNQLMVLPGAGRTVVITAGWAFINGAWYHNDEDLYLELAANNGVTNRTDSIRIRFTAVERKVSAIVLTGEVGVMRGDTIYDLELAEVLVTPNATTISASSISDKRPDGTVCGFVTGLLEVVSAGELFSQFQGMFDEWFNTVKDQVTGDLGIRLQQEFLELNQNVQDYQANVEQQIEIHEQTTVEQVAAIDTTATNAYDTMRAFVEADYTLPLQELIFTEGQCIVVDERVTSSSLIDVYFTADTMLAAENAQIYVDSEEGQIVLSAAKQPESALKARIRVRVM